MGQKLLQPTEAFFEFKKCCETITKKYNVTYNTLRNWVLKKTNSSHKESKVPDSIRKKVMNEYNKGAKKKDLMEKYDLTICQYNRIIYNNSENKILDKKHEQTNQIVKHYLDGLSIQDICNLHSKDPRYVYSRVERIYKYIPQYIQRKKEAIKNLENTIEIIDYVNKNKSTLLNAFKKLGYNKIMQYQIVRYNIELYFYYEKGLILLDTNCPKYINLMKFKNL